MTIYLTAPSLPYRPFTPSPSTSYPYFVRPEPVDAQQQPFQPFHMAPQTTILSAGACVILGKLKTRSALHIKLLGEDVERLRDFNPGIESHDKQSILGDVGILLQLRSQTAESALAVTKGPEAKLSKVKNMELKKLVEKMRAKKSRFGNYVKVVEDKWRELDTRKTATGEEGLVYHKDLGLLMQFSTDRRCAVVEKLLGLIQAGVIRDDGSEVLMGRKSFEFYYLKEEKDKWVVVAQEDTAVGEKQVEAVGDRVVAAQEVVGVEDKKCKTEDDATGSKKRKIEGEHVEDKKCKTEDNATGSKKPKAELMLPLNLVYGLQKKVSEGVPREYVPWPNEWKCKRCGWWSRGQWCTRLVRGRAICIGQRERNN
ncbi:hypothetical protein PtrSN002B_007382 [Pyrenophora tritici-repentis]|nr:hypothetical protein PtrSN002B_007382 [Pyrenophora tritici-repentis]